MPNTQHDAAFERALAATKAARVKELSATIAKRRFTVAEVAEALKALAEQKESK